MKKMIFYITLFLVIALGSCKKSGIEDTGIITPPPVTPGTPVSPSDPAIANTMGFFLDDWSAKLFKAPTSVAGTVPAASSACTVTADAAKIITKIPQSVFGTNAVSWMTQIVTEPALMSYLTNYHSHIIRFPGGSISDQYFWNRPADTPPTDVPATRVDENGNIINSNFWYGQVNYDWTISLDNYYKMLQQTGNQGMITVNYGYARYGISSNPVAAAAHLAADWVRYDNGRTKYWEVGNENFGSWEAGYRINTAANGDGQPELINGKIYGQHYKVFADSMRKAASDIGKIIYISAVIMEKAPASYVAANLQTWNADVMANAGSSPDFYSVHSYFTPYQQNSDVSAILGSVIPEEETIISYVKSGFAAANIPQKPVALTEWNFFAEGSGQQTSYISGMHALMVMGEALKNKFGMAARWDLANGWNNGNDMGLFNIGDEPGVPKWNARPSYYYMYFFQKILGDRLIESTVAGSADIKAYASSYSGGQMAVALINTGNTAIVTTLSFKNFTPGNKYYWYTLTGGVGNGAFSKNVLVNGTGSSVNSGGPSNYSTLSAKSSDANTGIKLDMPAYSVVYVMIEK